MDIWMKDHRCYGFWFQLAENPRGYKKDMGVKLGPLQPFDGWALHSSCRSRKHLDEPSA